MNLNSAIFVDTSGWAAPVAQDTDHQPEMLAFSRELIASGRILVTTNYVISELVPLLTSRTHLPRPRVLEFVGQVKQLARTIYIDKALDTEAWELLQQRPDKEWSQTDAASFVVMRQLGLLEAFTSDHHFLQAGFIRLPIIAG